MANLKMQVKSGKWYGYCYYYDKELKKSVPKWFSTGLNEKNNKTQATQICKKKMEEFFDKLRQEQMVKNKELLDYSLWEYIERYINERKDKIRDNTIEGYLSIRNVIKAYFGDKPIKDFTREDIGKFFDSQRNKGRTENTILHYYRLLNATFELAIEDFAYDKPNPLLKSKKKSDSVNIELEQEEIEFLEPEDQEKLYRIIEGTKLEIPYLISIYYGLRRGELCALEKSDFDFNNKEIFIWKSLYYKNKVKCSMNDPKAKKSRTLLFIDSVTEKIQNYISAREIQKEKWDADKKVYQIKYKQKKKKGVFSFDPLLRHENGDIIKPDYITHAFNKLLTKHKFEPHINWHSLRHTCASNLRKSGAKLEDLKDYLGHQSITTTMKYYSHLYEEDKEAKTKAYGICVDNILKL